MSDTNTPPVLVWLDNLSSSLRETHYYAALAAYSAHSTDEMREILAGIEALQKQVEKVEARARRQIYGPQRKE